MPNSSFSEIANNEMLNGGTFTGVKIHSGNPGSDGTENEVGGLKSASFGAASEGSRLLVENVLWEGLASEQLVTWFSVWEGSTFKGRGEIISGATQADEFGRYVLAAGTALKIQ